MAGKGVLTGVTSEGDFASVSWYEPGGEFVEVDGREIRVSADDVGPGDADRLLDAGEPAFLLETLRTGRPLRPSWRLAEGEQWGVAWNPLGDRITPRAPIAEPHESQLATAISKEPAVLEMLRIYNSSIAASSETRATAALTQVAIECIVELLGHDPGGADVWVDALRGLGAEERDVREVYWSLQLRRHFKTARALKALSQMSGNERDSHACFAAATTWIERFLMSRFPQEYRLWAGTEANSVVGA